MSSQDAAQVASEEQLVRLLFSTRMVDDSGTLGKEAFPVDELIEKSGKSVSVDELSKLDMPEHVDNKLETYQNPARDRHRWGFALAVCSQITSIMSQEGLQVYSVLKDPIEGNFPPAPWDHAHAKIIRADSSFGKGFVRGYRDKLTELYQENVEALP